MFGFDGEKDEDTTVEKTDSSNKETDNSDDEEDGSTEESDSKKNKSSDNEEGDEDSEEDIAKKYFTDPNSVPPQLRKAFKKMQGIFTKKQQELARGIEKATAFDQLILDPDFRKFMEMKRKGMKLPANNSNDDTEDDEDDDRPLTRKELREIMRQETKNAMKPFEEKEQMVELRAAANEFKKDNPDWELYKSDIGDLMNRHPTLSYQEAYDLASKEDKDEVDEEEKVARKKKGNISKPSKTGAKDVQEKKGKMSIQEAYQLAKKKLKFLT